MKQLRLKIQAEAVKLENVINFKRTERNNIIDERKRAKKEKDADAVEECNRQLSMTEQDIANLEAKYKEVERNFYLLRHKLGKIRLDLYVFADVIYNSLIEYAEFRKKYVVNPDDDNDVVKALETALENIKKLPFEMSDAGYTNYLYGAVTDKFLERWKTIRDGVIQEVLREVDNEYIDEQKTKKRK